MADAEDRTGELFGYAVKKNHAPKDVVRVVVRAIEEQRQVVLVPVRDRRQTVVQALGVVAPIRPQCVSLLV